MLRRAPLRRSGSLRRRSRLRARRKTSYRRRERNLEHLRFVRRQPCAAKGLGTCAGRVNADHAGRRGLGQKCDDTETIPLCELHHRQRTDFTGPFRNWDQNTMRAWLAEQVEKTQAFARERGVMP